MGRPGDPELLLTDRPPLLGDPDRAPPRQERAGLAAGRLLDLVDRPHGDDFAATDPRTRAEVDDVVRREHRLFVVLDDDDGVPLIAEVFEALEEHRVVAGMQPDRGFIEDVQDSDQPAADLPGEPDPLRLSPGEGRGGAVERQVVEAAAEQEPKPPPDLLECLGGDELLRLVERELLEERQGLLDAHRADLWQTERQ